MASGANNREIAGTLHVSERTVKSHVGAVFAKLGLSLDYGSSGFLAPRTRLHKAKENALPPRLNGPQRAERPRPPQTVWLESADPAAGRVAPQGPPVPPFARRAFPDVNRHPA